MTHHAWTILCSKSSIDKETNNMSLFEALEQLKMDISGPGSTEMKREMESNFAVTPYNFEINSLWYRDKKSGVEKSMMKAQIIDPDNKLLGENELPIIFEESKRRVRSTIRVSGFPVTRSGMYWIRILLSEKKGGEFTEATKLPIEVTINVK
jgi:hypothetical protein